jgi:hypothetical protein
MSRLQLAQNEHLRPGLARYITRLNHRTSPAGERLARFRIYQVRERTLAPGGTQPFPVNRMQLLSWDCFAKPPPRPEPVRPTIASPRRPGPAEPGT